MAIICLILLFNIPSQAQFTYNVSKFDNTWCNPTYTTAFQMGSFSITETSLTGNDGFRDGRNNETMVFTLSGNFIFNTTGTATVTSAQTTEITVNSLVFNSNTQFTVDVTTANSSATLITLNFNNFEVAATGAGTGSITRTGGNHKVDNSTSDASSFGDYSTATSMTFTSTTCTQTDVTTIGVGTTDNPIIGIQVVVSSPACNAFNVTSLNFDTDGNNGTGSNNPTTNILNAKVYYTGTTATFSPIGQFGPTEVGPNGTFTVTGTQALVGGTNYFWLTYDTKTTATTTELLDAQCTSVSMDGGIGAKTPTTQNPAGSRTIRTLFSRSAADYGTNGTWSDIALGGASCGCTPTLNDDIVVGHNVSLSGNEDARNVTVNLGSTITDGGNRLSIYGNLNLIGAIVCTNDLKFEGAGKTIEGSGTITITAKDLKFENGDYTIKSGSNLTITSSDVAKGIKINNNGITMTNLGTVTLNGTLAGNNASKTWVNAAGSVLNIRDDLLNDAGVLTANASTNTVNYMGTAQTVKVPSAGYDVLSFSTSGAKTGAGSFTVNTTLNMQGTATCAMGTNTITYGANATVVYAGSAAQTTTHEIEQSATDDVIPNMTINNAAGVILGTLSTGAANVTGTLTFTNGKITLGTLNLIVGTATTSGTITSASSAKYIVTTSTGYLQRYCASGVNTDFHVGNNTTYYDWVRLNAGDNSTFQVRVGAGPNNSPLNPAQNVQLEWQIDRTGGSAATTVQLNWNAAQEGASWNDAVRCVIGRHSGTAWVENASTAHTPGTQTASASFSSFSPFAVGSGSNPLPIVLSDFNIEVNDKAVLLTWETQTEVNNDYFSIERSADGKTFNYLGKVDGNGSSNSLQHYLFTDDHPLNGYSYYRIVQYDFDGQSKTYPVKSIFLETNQLEITNIFPNPAGKNAFIDIFSPDNEAVKIKIHNNYGQIVHEKEFELTSGNQLLDFDLETLSPGVYFIQVSDGKKDINFKNSKLILDER